MARKGKISPEVTERICEALRLGNTRHDSAIYGGISEKTFYNWIERGEKGEDKYVQFLQHIKSAETEAIMQSVEIIRNAALDGTWQAAAWYLERRRPDDWGKDRKDDKGDRDGLDDFLESMGD